MSVQRRKDSKGRVLKEGEYERPNGTYSYVYKDAMRRKRTIYAPTLIELREKEEAALQDRRDGIDSAAASTTINDLYKGWKKSRELDVRAGILRQRTMANYAYMYEMYVMPGFGRKVARDVTSPMVGDFYKTLIMQKGFKVNSITNVHVPLTQVFDYGVDSRILRYNPCNGVMRKIATAYRQKEVGLASRKRVLSVDQEKLFLDALQSSETNLRWYPLFKFFLNTGLRVGELTGLIEPDVDLEEELVDVNHTLVYFSGRGAREMGSCYYINATKTPSGMRRFPLLPDAVDAVREEVVRRKKAHLCSQMTIDGYRGFVFLNRFGDCLNECTINRAIKRIVHDCNMKQLEKGSNLLLPSFSCHWLRHTFATRMMEKGVSKLARQTILGHSPEGVTDSVYTDVSIDYLREELGKMAA